MPWKAPTRNWDKIQHEKVRKLTDFEFNKCHDALSVAYYDGSPFVWENEDYGILTKADFDKYHGLIFKLGFLCFHKTNFAQAPEDRIPEEEYNHEYDKQGNLIAIKNERITEEVKQLKQEGYNIKISCPI